ncbi:MAG: hypothetical protein ABSH12_09485 [Endomicrobiales bacterium]
MIKNNLYFKNNSGKTRTSPAISAALAVFICLLVFVLVLTVILNGIIEKKIEKSFHERYHTCSLIVSGLRYNFFKNRFSCKSLVIKKESGVSCTAGPVSVSGIGWLGLLYSPVNRERAFDGTAVEVNDVYLNGAGYALSCKRLTFSVRDGRIRAVEIDLKTLSNNERFFAARRYRTTRFRLNIPELIISGLDGSKFVDGRSFKAHSIVLNGPSLDALVDKYAAVDKKITRELMPNEMMITVNKQVFIEKLKVISGRVTYGEEYAPGAVPATVTFDNINLMADNISNNGQQNGVSLFQVRANFMQSGAVDLNVVMSLSSRAFSLQYSGSLGTMDMRKLNAFLEHSEYIRIDSGTIQKITFDIGVSDGHATGAMKALYKDLKITVLSRKTGGSNGIINKLSSLLMNHIAIRRENMADTKTPFKTAKIEYIRKPQNTFLQFLWFSLRSGVLDVLFLM